MGAEATRLVELTAGASLMAAVVFTKIEQVSVGGTGVWRRLVARPLWERKAAGSNPATPTGVQTRSALLHPVGEPDAGRASVCGEGRAATASTASGYPDNIMPTACSAAPPT